MKHEAYMVFKPDGEPLLGTNSDNENNSKTLSAVLGEEIQVHPLMWEKLEGLGYTVKPVTIEVAE